MRIENVRDRYQTFSEIESNRRKKTVQSVFLRVRLYKWRKEDEWVERKFSSESTSVYERTPVSEYRGRN